jgi:CheY-like chemotaxis protein
VEEDNPANVAFMTDLVTSLEDIELVATPTAERGIEIARARLPEVIIKDINLPGMRGLDSLRVLRGIVETRDIPVIALTAAASERDKHKGLVAGFSYYLTKPVQVDELVCSRSPLRECSFCASGDGLARSLVIGDCQRRRSQRSSSRCGARHAACSDYGKRVDPDSNRCPAHACRPKPSVPRHD